jgi:hypothetical protein
LKAKLLGILALTLCTALFMAPFMAPMANAKKRVTILDLVTCIYQYGRKPGGPHYNATIVEMYDTDWNTTGNKPGPDNNGAIGITDLIALSRNFTG